MRSGPVAFFVGLALFCLGALLGLGYAMLQLPAEAFLDLGAPAGSQRELAATLKAIYELRDRVDSVGERRESLRADLSQMSGALKQMNRELEQIVGRLAESRLGEEDRERGAAEVRSTIDYAALQVVSGPGQEGSESSFLLPERELLRRFGMPSRIDTSQACEWWFYWEIENGRIVRQFRFRVSAGRAIGFDTWEDSRPVPATAEK